MLWRVMRPKLSPAPARAAGAPMLPDAAPTGAMTGGQASRAAGGPAILLGGPTAAGKSALALWLAERFDGEIVNADSMQVYADLEILTARPAAAVQARCRHHLFGVMDAARRCSAGLWHRLARRAAGEIAARGRVPILVGGSGLYLAAFHRGLAPVPPVSAALRAELGARMAAEGPARLHGELARRDPASAAALAPGDRQRIQRALEVEVATGVPLSRWRRMARRGAWPGPCLFLVLAPPRAPLYRLCDRRFDAMLEAGALAEAKALAARRLDPSLPAMRALGVPQLIAHLEGALDLASAAAHSKRATRRYAKRQATWFRHQAGDGFVHDGFGFEAAAGAALAQAVARFLLTAPPSVA